MIIPSVPAGQADISTSLAPTDYVSYAQVVGAGNKETPSTTSCGSDGELCPTYLMSGKCQLGEQCSYIHGLMCEVCQLACLHPFDEEQRRIHKEVRHVVITFTVLPWPLSMLHSPLTDLPSHPWLLNR